MSFRRRHSARSRAPVSPPFLALFPAPLARRASDLVAALVAEAVPAGDGALDLRLPDADLRAR